METRATRQPRARSSGQPAKPRNVRHYVLWLLGRREWSEQELRARLKQRGCEPEEIDDAVGYAKSSGLQSDDRFAGSKARLEGRRKGDRSVRYALSSKGIEPEQIAAEIAALEPETERVIGALRRFEGKTPDLKLKGKVWRFLASRGFTRSAVDAGWAHLLNGARNDDAGDTDDDASDDA